MLLLGSLLACTDYPAENWVDSKPTCGEAVHEWSDDLLGYIAQGDGSGSFDFDPPDAARSSIKGAYDSATGDFSWVVNYDGDYFLDRQDAEGFGTVYHNGDLDLLWSVTTRDVLDRSSTTWERLVREGCDVTRTTWEDGDEAESFRTEGSFEDDSTYAWNADVEGYDWRGTAWSDGSWRELIEAADNSYDYRTDGFEDGHEESSFNVACYDGLRCAGTGDLAFDGITRQTFEVRDGADKIADVETEFAYDGAGTQVVRYSGGPTCTYTLTADEACSYRCDDGDRGSC